VTAWQNTLNGISTFEPGVGITDLGLAARPGSSPVIAHTDTGR
jgi:hypothetical protein